MAWPALAALAKGGAAAGGASSAAGGGAAAGGAAKGGGGMMSMMGKMGGGGGGGNMMGGLQDRANMPKQAVMGLASGMLQTIQAQKLKRKAESAMPGMIDPNQASYLSELNQKRKAIDTGADFAAGMQTIDQGNAATNEAITRNTGGNVASTIQSLLQSQKVASDAKNNVLAQGQQQQQFYNAAYGGLLDQISARKLQLQMYRSQQARGEWAAKQQSANQNLMAGVAGLMEQKQQYGQPVTTSPMGTGPSNMPVGNSTGFNPVMAEKAGQAMAKKQTFGSDASPVINEQGNLDARKQVFGSGKKNPLDFGSIFKK
jgi:hypothetical protein